MSLAKRIIPCLDVDKGVWLKVSSLWIFAMQDPVEVPAETGVRRDYLPRYYRQPRGPHLHTVERMWGVYPADRGWRCSRVTDIRNLLNAGADKVAINSAAINPEFVRQAAERFGSQVLWWLLMPSRWSRNSRDGRSLPWRAQTHRYRCYRMGEDDRFRCSEILLTSMDRDGIKRFDLGSPPVSVMRSMCRYRLRWCRQSATGGRYCRGQGRCSAGSQYLSLRQIHCTRGQQYMAERGNVSGFRFYRCRALCCTKSSLLTLSS